MDRLQSMAMFARVVEAGSFAAAARRLGVTRAAISKRLQHLEADLGIRLLNRTTRRVTPTETGRAYYDSCLRVLAEAEEADALIRRLHSEPGGTLRINAPQSFGTLHLGPAIAAFAARYPALAVSVTLNDRAVNLNEEDFDVALRIARQTAPTLIARRLSPIELVLCASPAYLAAHGTPRRAVELGRHHCLHYAYAATGESWHIRDPSGDHEVRIHSRFGANSGELLLEAARAGIGIALIPSFIARPALADGSVLRLLPDAIVPPLSLFVVHARHPAPSAKVTLLVDFLADWFGPDPYWDRGRPSPAQRTASASDSSAAH